MLAVLSPSKTQDFSDDLRYREATKPIFAQDSLALVAELQKYSVTKLQTLMSISQKLAELNHERYHHFQPTFTKQNSRQALLAFRGDVYDGIDVQNYTDKEFSFAQKSLRILSGLYGALRPLDLIQPYRLEMKTKLKNERGNDLYQFWGEHIRNEVEKIVQRCQTKVLINLASNEYFKALQPAQLKIPVIQIDFKEKKGGALRTVALFAKQARGNMADFIVRERLTKPDDLKGFARDKYRFSPSHSSEDRFVFIR